jgi:hypothetical protein
VVVLVVVVALLESVMLPVVIVVSLVADDVSVSLAVVVVVSGGGAVSPMSKIRVDIEPLAENVDPSVAFVVVALPVPVWFVVVVVVVVVVVLVALVEVVAFDVAFCAIAGARLNTATKSPKTTISVTAIGAFFISQSVHE